MNVRRFVGRAQLAHFYDHGQYWLGSKEELVAAGVCRADQFPGEPGRNKTLQTYKDGGRETRIERKSKCVFSVYLSIEELAARAAAETCFRKFLGTALQSEAPAADSSASEAVAGLDGKSDFEVLGDAMQELAAIGAPAVSAMTMLASLRVRMRKAGVH